MARALVGTSGWTYPHWRNTIYPPKVPQRAWLRHYGNHFETVELNITFYRLAKAREAEAWHDQTPPHFRFVAKGSRYITHMKKLKDAQEPLRRFFEPLEPLRTKLEAILWQLPPKWDADPTRLRDFLQAIAAHDTGARLRHAFEFRDRSWHQDKIHALLHEARHAVVFADAAFETVGPDQARLGRAESTVRVPWTSDWAYVRRHGTLAHGAGGYSPSQIAQDAAALHRWLHDGRDAYVFYNNDREGAAWHNAQALAAALAARRPRPRRVRRLPEKRHERRRTHRTRVHAEAP
jgi:uncharacterized protein YecE (DUF72 family)